MKVSGVRISARSLTKGLILRRGFWRQDRYPRATYVVGCLVNWETSLECNTKLQHDLGMGNVGIRLPLPLWPLEQSEIMLEQSQEVVIPCRIRKRLHTLEAPGLKGSQAEQCLWSKGGTSNLLFKKS